MAPRLSVLQLRGRSVRTDETNRQHGASKTERSLATAAAPRGAVEKLGTRNGDAEVDSSSENRRGW